MRKDQSTRHFRATIRAAKPWAGRVFAFVGLPKPLELEDFSGVSFSPFEVIKPRFYMAHRDSLRNGIQLDADKVVCAFRDAFRGKTGDALENAAAELLLTSGPLGKESDWQRFVTWAAHRQQPLPDPLIDAFGRFYADRLNRILSGRQESAPRAGAVAPACAM